MGRPVDRVPGVVLVTDYGALDRALEQKRRQEEQAALDQMTPEQAQSELRSLMSRCLFNNENN